jgi:hypothetical protein
MALWTMTLESNRLFRWPTLTSVLFATPICKGEIVSQIIEFKTERQRQGYAGCPQGLYTAELCIDKISSCISDMTEIELKLLADDLQDLRTGCLQRINDRGKEAK